MEDDIGLYHGRASACRAYYHVLRNDINTNLVYILVGQQAEDLKICRAISARDTKGFSFCSPADIQ